MIRVEKDGRVALLTLDRAERRNALGSAMIERLDEALVELDADAGVGAVVLSGAAPSFCAGSDLKELGRMDVAGMAHHEAVTAAVARRIALLDKPVIAAVEGYAYGGGFILACSCDLVVSSSGAKWNLAEVPNGWLPPWGLQALLARVGPVNARRLTWGHEVLDGEQACRIGVADYLAPEGRALDQARSLAERLAGLPAPAVASTKRFFAHHVAGGAETADAATNRIFIENCQHEAAKATLARFGAKA